MKGRTGALLALVAIEKGKRAQNALHAVFEKYGVKKKDKALATELTYGVTRWRKRLDYILSHYLKTPLSDLTPYIRNILRIGVYSILFMKTPRYAAVSECVKLAKRYGHEGVAGLVNAVLRRIEDRVEYPEEDIERLSVYYSLPEWIVARAFELFGEDAEKFLIASNGAPPLSIRVNLKKTTPKELVSLLRRSGIKVEKGMYLPYSLRVEGKALETKFMREGLFTVQDESSSFVVELLSPEPGDGILEVCSAPGGKTTHIAEKGGKVVAVDTDKEGLSMVVKGAERLGLSGIYPVLGDGRNIAFRKKFDKILIDAPCSGLGVLRRRPDLRWNIKEEDIPRLVELQFAILKNVSRYLKKGGVLVYSTCTVEPYENELLIKRFLEEENGWEVEDAGEFLPEEVVRDGYLATYPHIHGMDGVFGARLKKKGG